MPVIITEFKFQQVGAEEVTAELANQAQLESKVVSEVNKVNAAFEKQTKIVGEDAKATDTLVNSLKKIPQSLVGQSVRQMQELAKAIKGGTLQIDAFQTATSAAKKQLQQLAPETAAFKKLESEIKASILVNEKLNKTFTSTKGELRAMKEALLQLEDAGFENTKLFEDLSLEAANLEDRVGDAQARIKTLASDTFKFDAAIGAVQGVAAAFSIAQGVAGLFGSESEKVQQALLKVNAAMAILTGLQQIQNTLQKQTAISIAVENALRRLSALNISLQSAAESRYTVVRFLAIKAQAALNAVMAANPAGVLLIAIGALAGALLYLTSNTDDSAKAQEELNRKAELVNDSLRRQVDIVNELAEADARQIQKLRASGASAQAIRAAGIAVLDTQIRRQTALIETLRERAGVEEEFDAAVQKRQELISDREIALLQDQTDRAKEYKELLNKSKAETLKFLDDIIAGYEIAVAESVNGFDRLTAQIELIQARLRKTLATTDLTQNQRVKAEIDAGEEIKKARQELTGEIQKLDTQNVASYADGLKQEVLANAQKNKEILTQEQNAANARKKIAEDEAAKRKSIQEQSFDAAVFLSNSLAQSTLEISRNQNQAELDALETKKQKELEIQQKRLDQGVISQDQYEKEVTRIEQRQAQEVTKIRRRQAEQEKDNAIFTATINAFAAIVKVFSTIGPPLSFILAGATAAATLAQIAAIRSKPLPAFEKGTKNAPGGPSLVAERGAELYQQADGSWHIAAKPSIVDLDAGAKVFTAAQTSRMIGASNVYPSPPGYVATTKPRNEFDYKKMGKAIAGELGKLPITEVNMDERGFTRHQDLLKNRAIRQAKRYSSGV